MAASIKSKRLGRTAFTYALKDSLISFVAGSYPQDDDDAYEKKTFRITLTTTSGNAHACAKIKEALRRSAITATSGEHDTLNVTVRDTEGVYRLFSALQNHLLLPAGEETLIEFCAGAKLAGRLGFFHPDPPPERIKRTPDEARQAAAAMAKAQSAPAIPAPIKNRIEHRAMEISTELPRPRKKAHKSRTSPSGAPKPQLASSHLEANDALECFTFNLEHSTIKHLRGTWLPDEPGHLTLAITLPSSGPLGDRLSDNLAHNRIYYELGREPQKNSIYFLINVASLNEAQIFCRMLQAENLVPDTETFMVEFCAHAKTVSKIPLRNSPQASFVYNRADGPPHRVDIGFTDDAQKEIAARATALRRHLMRPGLPQEQAPDLPVQRLELKKADLTRSRFTYAFTRGSGGLSLVGEQAPDQTVAALSLTLSPLTEAESDTLAKNLKPHIGTLTRKQDRLTVTVSSVEAAYALAGILQNHGLLPPGENEAATFCARARFVGGLPFFYADNTLPKSGANWLSVLPQNLKSRIEETATQFSIALRTGQSGGGQTTGRGA